MEQFTKEEALQIYQSGSWKKLTDLQLAGFQLYQQFVFCDFGRYRDCLNKALYRGAINSQKEGARFRTETGEALREEWEHLHNVPEFSHMKSLLLGN